MGWSVYFERSRSGQQISPPASVLIPASRLTTFQPGVTYNGVAGNGLGIPNRTTVFQTVNPLGGNSNVTISIASPAVVTGLGTGSTPAVAANTAFIFQTTGALPTGITTNTLYYVIATGLAANSFQFSATQGGAAVNTSGTQSGTQSILLDDTGAVQTAMNNCTAGQVVALGAGTFTITGNGLNLHTSNITVRGAGPGPGSAIKTGSPGPATAPGTYTALWKADSNVWGGSSPFGCFYVNQFGGHFTDNGTSVNLTADAIKGSNSCTVSSAAALSVGQLVLIDHNTDNDSNTFWGNANDPAGAAFNGSVSGTALTINSFNTNISNGSVATGQHVFYSGGLVGQIASGSGLSWTLQASGPTITNVNMESGNGTRRFFGRQDRSSAQMMKISGINGNTVTFETIFHITHPTLYAAQLVTSPDTEVTGSGIENLYLYAGVGGDGNGNLPFSFCSYCWAKNIESHYSTGTGVGFYSCYRCELRDSYMHETPSPSPGGGGYLSGMNQGTADSLFENNIMWCGNKVVVMRNTGGGNVIAYNYMDDAFGSGYPQSPEAGLNAGHMTTPHFELIEGNYCFSYKGDAFWGNSIYITVFRNWLSGLRAANNIHTNFTRLTLTTNATSAAGTNVLHFASTDGVIVNQQLVTDTTTFGLIPVGTTVISLTTTTVTLSANITGAGVGNGDTIVFTFDGTFNNFALEQSTVTYPYVDSWVRVACDIQAHSYFGNIAANVLGYNGQGFYGFTSGGTSYLQNSFVYENLGTSFPATGTEAEIYRIGQQQDPGQTIWVAGQDATILRQGNWDWLTQSQRWHGIGGAPGSGQTASIPSSYYLTGKPAFWGGTTWPWVDPSTGSVFTLPALTRFESLTGVVTPIPPGNAIDQNWWKRFQYAGNNPAVTLDFANGLYWNGVETSTVVSGMVAGSPTVTAGSGLLCNSTGITATGALLTAIQAASYSIQVCTFGGTNNVTAGIVAESTDGSTLNDQFLTENSGNLDTFRVSGSAQLQTSGVAIDWTKAMWIAISNSPSTPLRALSGWGNGSVAMAGGQFLTDANNFTANPPFVFLGSLTPQFPSDNFGGFINNMAAFSTASPFLTKTIPPPAFTSTNGWWWNFSTSSKIDYGNVLQFEYTQPWTSIVAFCVVADQRTPSAVQGIFHTNVPASGTAEPGYEFWLAGDGFLHVRIIHDFGSGLYIGKVGTTDVRDGLWHVGVATYDGSGLAAGVNLYLDGVLQSMTTESDTLGGGSIKSSSPANDFQVGNQAGTTDGLPGAIGLFRLYNVVKPLSYIQQFKINRALPIVDSSCVLAPNLNEGGSSTTTADQSASNFTGTLNSSNCWLRG